MLLSKWRYLPASDINLTDDVVDSLIAAVYRAKVSVVSGAVASMLVAALVLGAGPDARLRFAAWLLLATASCRIALIGAWTARDKLLPGRSMRFWERAYLVVGAAFAGSLGLMCYFTLADHVDLDLAFFVVTFCITFAALLPTRNGARPRIVFLQTLLVILPAGAGFVASGHGYFAIMGLMGVFFLMATRDGTKALYETLISLLVAQKHLDAALNNMSHGLLMLDSDMRVLVANTKFQEFFNLPEQAIMPGANARETILKHLLKSVADRRERNAMTFNFGCFIKQRSTRKFSVRTGDGRVFEFSLEPMQGGFVASVQDVTERHEAERKIMRMARYDLVTELPNRARFREEMDAVIARGESFAVLCVDLDRFKQVNDSFGHPIGDKLLNVVSKRIIGLAGPGDIVSRFGGDEFIVLRIGSRREDFASFAEDIVRSLGAPYSVDGHRVVIGASVGIAISPTDGVDPDRLLKNADMALYDAKASGRTAFSFFCREMEATAESRRRLELDLRAAIENDELEVWYQPLVDIDSHRVTSCEALVRWRSPQRGLVLPSEFIGVAEETGLIIEIGERVLQRGCRDAATWPEDIRLAVNFSAVQFARGRTVQAVKQALVDSGLLPQRLDVEITESVLLKDSEATMRVVQGLRQLGVGISLDDFGTGYSSLGYLNTFRPDKVKIDQSFVRDLDKATGSSIVIVRALAEIARDFGIGLVVEGVETASQLEMLRLAGAKEAQGYLFSRPLPAPTIAALLADAKRRDCGLDEAAAVAAAA